MISSVIYWRRASNKKRIETLKPGLKRSGEKRNWRRASNKIRIETLSYQVQAQAILLTYWRRASNKIRIETAPASWD